MATSSNYDAFKRTFIILSILLIFGAIGKSVITNSLQPQSTGVVTSQPAATQPHPAQPHPAQPHPDLPKQKTPPRTEKPVQMPKLPSYKISTILPTEGGSNDLSLMINECHHSGDSIICTGMITNNTDAPTQTGLYGCNATDDEGNTFSLGSVVGTFYFPGVGGQFRLMPGVPTKVMVDVPDPHRNVKAINLQLYVDWDGNPSHLSPVFKGIPVQ